MSKFTDRLKRLHGSRVRALEENDEPSEKRVFHAEEVAEPAPTSATPAPSETSPAAERSKRSDVERSAKRQAIRQQLQRGERLKTGGRSKLRMRRQGDQASSPPEPDTSSEEPTARPRPDRPDRPASTSDNRVGERLAELRIQAEALIEVGAIEAALPMVHEMLALSPDNPYPLGVLVRYWRSRGDETLARLYEVRLQKSAPY